MTTDPKSIRPARGLWAAVRPEGVIYPETVRATAAAAKCRAVITMGSWDDLAARGWRIAPVDVIPSEEKAGD